MKRINFERGREKDHFEYIYYYIHKWQTPSTLSIQFWNQLDQQAERTAENIQIFSEE